MDHYLGPQRLLEVDGDAARRARQQGEACASQYASAASCIGSLVLEPRWIGPRVHTRVSQAGLAAAGAYYLARHRSALRRFDGGRFWRAQEGLARGSGLPLPLSFGLGAVPELVGSQLGYSLGCSAVAVAHVDGPQHGTGLHGSGLHGSGLHGSGLHGQPPQRSTGPKIFYNHDFPPRFGRYSFVRRNRPSDGHASVCLTYPIMVGCLAGVNEPGLAITLNHAFANDYHGRAGILLTSLVQAVLDRCTDVESALDLLRDAPVTNGAILTLADRRGARAVVEVSCTAMRVRRPTELLACSFNRYQHPEMAQFEIPERAVSTGLVPGILLHESNLARHARWAELVANRFDDRSNDPEARVSEDDMRELMTDHRGGRGDKNTICRHDDPLSETLWTAVLSPEDRTVDVHFGHACEGRPVRYALARSPIPEEGRAEALHAAHASN